MSLAAGTKLGPYEILSPLGAGGMGEVYKARDTRLSRDVAIKILPAAFSHDAERLRRFEHEARAAGVLNHPNLTAIYDIGTHDGAPYVVQELLEGETLRTALASGSLPPRRAVEYGLGMARGLAAAHEKGIVHRDLKPENVFVTGDGRIKILDFGLAKLMLREETGSVTEIPTETAGTGPGVVLGTLGYMSPEQVRAQPADARSDIFSLGTILYEMLSGRRPFRGDSAADTMSAILREDPPDLSLSNQTISPGLEKIVRRCLEKSPERRFHSAHDVAFALEDLTDSSSTSALRASPGGRRGPRALPLAGAALAAAVALGAAYVLGTRKAPPPLPSYRQLTFRRGPIHAARFGSDGKSILYSAAWGGQPHEVYVVRPGSPESQPFGFPSADVLAVSSAGDVAIALGSRAMVTWQRVGTLARVGATGGAPRELLEDVQAADWSPDGKDLAVVRAVSGRNRLEFPIGKSLYETTGWIGDPRLSPTGDRIAFVDHPAINDDGGVVTIVDREGRKSAISPLFASAQGLAWSPDGSEVWFTAAEEGGNRALYAVTPSGRRRVLARVTGMLTLRDVARDGRVLVAHEVSRTALAALPPGEARERDLTWLDWSTLRDLSEDGRTVLIAEEAEGGGTGYSVFIRRTDGSPAVRLGEGSALSLSPDGKRVLALLHPTGDRQLRVYSTGAGESKDLSLPNLRVGYARFLPDGQRFLVSLAEPGARTRVYIWDIAGGRPRPLTSEGYGDPWPSPDGERFLARGPDRRLYVCTVGQGEPAAIAALTPDDSVHGWTSQPGTIYARRGRSLPARIVRVDLATGRIEPWRDLMPEDATGVTAIWRVYSTRDGSSYAYSYSLDHSDLFLVEGLK